MRNNQKKKVAAAAYNAEYEVVSDAELGVIATRVIEMLHDQWYEYVGAMSHKYSNFDKRTLGKGFTAIQNRVVRNLGLVSKYNAKGEVRTPI